MKSLYSSTGSSLIRSSKRRVVSDTGMSNDEGDTSIYISTALLSLHFRLPGGEVAQVLSRQWNEYFSSPSYSLYVGGF